MEIKNTDEIKKEQKGTGYFDKVVIKKLFEDLIVGEIDLDYKEYIADILIEINSVGTYSTKEVATIIEKIEILENMLVSQGFIHDIRFGDLTQGTWRIFVHFLDENEIEEWEKNAIKG